MQVDQRIQSNARKAAASLGYIPPQWQRLLEAGWIIEPTSCMCGGDWAWLKPRPSGAHEMFGCVCHTDISTY